jgi:glycoprotein-N-acetylgalactosamine 3-beta-galactosyltransferase
LWNKLNETLAYVWENYAQDYDWFFKVDDDSYVVMENLKVFLSQVTTETQQQEQQQQQQQPPLVFGYPLTTYPWSFWRDPYFTGENNSHFGDFFYNQVKNASSATDYCAGGSGYVMNKAYLQTFLKALKSPLTLKGTPPEDMAHGATMAAIGILPSSAKDYAGRERFLPEPPNLIQWKHEHYMKRKRILMAGSKCCSRYTVSFHHLTPQELWYLEDQFYTCRRLTL